MLKHLIFVAPFAAALAVVSAEPPSSPAPATPTAPAATPAPKTDAPPTPARTPLVIPAPKRTLAPGIIEDPAKLKLPAVPLDITIDISQIEKDYPEMKEWAEHAAKVCKTWYPILCDELNSDGFKPRDKVTFVFLPKQNAPAAAGGGRITVSTEYAVKHLDDYGMMVHELTHVVQAYGRGNRDTGWLTEAIADYTRFYKYESDPTHGGINANTKYNSPYRAGAAFLNYLSEHYDKTIVKKLNAAMRKGGFDDKAFRAMLADNPDVKPEARKDLDTLFKSFHEAHLAKYPPRQRNRPPADAPAQPAKTDPPKGG